MVPTLGSRCPRMLTAALRGFPCFQWGLKMMSLLVDKKALMDILIFLAILQGIFLCVSVCLCVLFYRLM